MRVASEPLGRPTKNAFALTETTYVVPGCSVSGCRERLLLPAGGGLARERDCCASCDAAGRPDAADVRAGLAGLLKKRNAFSSHRLVDRELRAELVAERAGAGAAVLRRQIRRRPASGRGEKSGHGHAAVVNVHVYGGARAMPSAACTAVERRRVVVPSVERGGRRQRGRVRRAS